MAISEGHGFPIAFHVTSASPAEVTLVEPTLDDRFLPAYLERMPGDMAYDSDGLDATLATGWGIEMIAPHRSNRKTPTQDGRPLRRRRRRWKVERLFAWCHNFRRLVTRWEYYPENFLGMWHLAAMLIVVKRVL
jgi:transposase